MKKFAFRLENVLNHRDIVKEKAKGEWVEAQRKVKECEDFIRDLQSDIMRSRQEIISLSSSGTGQAASMDRIHQFIEGTKIQIQRLNLRLRELKVDEEDKQLALIQANRDLRALETLKEKKKDEFKKTYVQEEQKKSDDAVLMRFKRNR